MAGKNIPLTRRKLGKSVGAGIAMVSLAGCTGQGGGQEKPKFLAPNPLSGPAALPGKHVRKGVELRMKELDEEGGVEGVTPQGQYENDKCSGETAIGITQNAVSQESNLFAWVGGYCSPTTLATMALTRREEIMQIVTSFAPSVTGSGHPFILRVAPSSNVVVPPQVNYAINELGAKRHAVLGINNAWGKAQTEAWRDIAKERGAEIVSFHQVPTDQTDYSNQVTEIASKNPDVIYTLGYHGHTANMLTQLRDQGITPGENADVFTASIAGHILTAAAGPETLAGVHAPLYFIGPEFANYPDAAPDYMVNFVDSWRKEYDEDPIRESATGYAMAETLVQAMTEVDGSYADKVPEMVEGIRGRSNTYTTPLGPIKFDDKGQADLNIFIAQHDEKARLHVRQKPQGS